MSQADRLGMDFVAKYGGSHEVKLLQKPNWLGGARLGLDCQYWDKVDISFATSVWGANDEIRVDMFGKGDGGESVKDAWVVPVIGLSFNVGSGYRLFGGDTGWGIVTSIRPGLSIFRVVGHRVINMKGGYEGDNPDLIGRFFSFDLAATIRNPDHPFILEAGYRMLRFPSLLFASNFDMDGDKFMEIKAGKKFLAENGVPIPFELSGFYIRTGFMFRILGLKAEKAEAIGGDAGSKIPKGPSPYEQEYGIANEEYTAGQYDTAIQRLKVVVKQDPKYWEAWQLLGNAYYAKGQKDDAIRAYDKSLVVNPENPQLKAWVESIRTPGPPN